MRLTARLVAISIIGAAVLPGAGSIATNVMACPGPPPQPLRKLYVESDLVVVARAGKTEVKSEIRKTADNEYEIKLSTPKTALLVSSTLKGESQPVVYVSRTIFGDYQDQLSSAKDDDTFLIFLRKREGDDAYFIDNMNFGVKLLSEADLKVYVSRIEELASIMKAEKPSDQEIVEWLVRCAEEPATRWEGTFDLAMNKYARQAEAELINENASTDASVESYQSQATEMPMEQLTPVQVENETIERLVAEPLEANFLELLTVGQKDRLMTTLINGKLEADRDSYLLDVVKEWDDPRLVPYLLSQLRQMNDESNYNAEQLMSIIAQKLNDDTLTGIVEKLSTFDNDYSETTEDGDDGIQDAATIEKNAQQEAVNEQAAMEKRKTTIQYFIAMAENTAPRIVVEQPVDTSAPVQP